IGAFLSFHAVELGYAYKLNKEIVEFRNRVIHKGEIPTPEQAVEFCQMVYNEIHPLFTTISTEFSDAYNKVVMQDLATRHAALPPDIPRATSSGTIFRMIKPSFQEAYKDFLEARHSLRALPESKQ